MQIHYVKKYKPYTKKGHAAQFHLYNVLYRQNLFTAIEIKILIVLECTVLAGQRHEGTLWGDKIILYISCNYGLHGIYICQNSPKLNQNMCTLLN